MALSSAHFRRNKLAPLLQRDHTLHGAILCGLNGMAVEIQARATSILSQARDITQVTTITGMASGAVREATQRIGGAFAKLGIAQSDVEILINLAPADLPKLGTSLDLPLAIVMLQAAGQLPDLAEFKEGELLLMGELGIHGEVRRIPGALSLAFLARPGQSLILPSGNECECSLILAKPGHEGCHVFPVAKLEEVIAFFRNERRLEHSLAAPIHYESAIEKPLDFGLIRGQTAAKDAALIAAAGGHNMLLVGPPGEGKSLIASALPGILPRLTDSEKVELTRIYSACGKLERDAMAVTRRPVRSVHHTASQSALIGGGSGIPKPGEITLAHLGVLFLDELAEFSRATLESLRQPMETGNITVSRSMASIQFPCRFTLIAAMNPCPCGYFGNERCTCRESQVKKYQSKISGPLLDRLDLQVEVKPLTDDERFAAPSAGQSSSMRRIVEKAVARQRSRFTGTGISSNAAIPAGNVHEICGFSADGLSEFKRIVSGTRLSTRSVDRLAKVARTIADLDDSNDVEPSHVDNASRFVIGNVLSQLS